VLVGFVGALLGRVDLQGSASVTGVMFAVCAVLGGGAVVGHFVALAHPERRSLADLIGGTMVVPRAATAAAALDADEQEMARARRRARLRNGAIAEVILLAGALFLPWRLAQRSTGKQEYMARQELVALEHQLVERPTDVRLAAEAAALADATGQPDRADAIRKKHRDAVVAVESRRLTSLRATLAERPADDEARDALVELLETRGERDEARKVREAGFLREGTAEAQAEWGAWLYSREYTRDAVEHLRAALDGGFDDPEVHAYLGRSLVKLEQKAEARLELNQAFAADPEGEADLADDVAEIDKELGPLPAPDAGGRPGAKPGSKPGKGR
jgi:tetratricopeptide (TPR) repeat protein